MTPIRPLIEGFYSMLNFVSVLCVNFYNTLLASVMYVGDLTTGPQPAYANHELCAKRIDFIN